MANMFSDAGVFVAAEEWERRKESARKVQEKNMFAPSYATASVSPS
jgi:hypothetical protein